MANKNCVSKRDLEALHEKKKGCLTRHLSRNTKSNPCSHIHQAQIRAEGDSDTYNYPKYKSFCRPKGSLYATTQSGFRAKSEKGQIRGETFYKNRPTHEGQEWDTEKGKNFKNSYTPYWNEAHHIIPSAALDNSISEIGKSKSSLVNLVKQSLLLAEYNLNKKNNMIILPIEMNVAEALELPRHGSHYAYSTRMEKKLKVIMKEYAETLDETEDNKGKHPPIPGKLSKEKLERLSIRTYPKIKAQGKSKKGQLIS